MDVIKITVDDNHYLRCPVDTIARDGEGHVIKLEITFPEKLSSYWVYLDFKMSNGEKFKSSRLDVEGNTATYLVPPYVLCEGKLKIQVLFQNEAGAIWKSYKKPFTVRPSINAVDDIPDKADFIAEAQKLLDDIKNADYGTLDTYYIEDYAFALSDDSGNVAFVQTNEGEVQFYGKGEGGGTTVVYSPVDFAKCGLPVLYLNGDTSKMTKDDEVVLSCKFVTAKAPAGASSSVIYNGTCKCKWQGSSSVERGYPKRNYTIKFDSEFEATRLWPYDSERVTNFPNKDGVEVWGKQKKYCAKANWIDPSGVRNVASARLWACIVKDRADRYGNVPEKLLSAPNYGAIDGFPIIIAINGEFEGLYTFNIPKDDWTFNMGDGAAEYVVVGENNSLEACGFMDKPQFEEDANGNLDFDIEYIPDDVDKGTLVASFQTAVNAVNGCSKSAAWEDEVAEVFDVDSAIDYLIFVCCIGARDNLRKNALYATYDGKKWFMSAYDLDTTFGANVHGKGWYSVVNDRNQFAESCKMHRAFDRIVKYSTARLVDRYDELRGGILSDENVWYVLQNFANDIPRAVYNMDAERWADEWDGKMRPMPSTTTANVENYMHYYRMHCAYLDKEIEALRAKGV
ncbi:MAG: CotH kinase family protein [Bacteroidaceae bacterium]|nr:CotH kinase family protein [Bacteroidaceae bacterium]